MPPESTRPVLIAVAPNGARKTQRDHPRLPLRPAELAECARTCVAAGASMLHLHVRDAAGRHSLAVADYEEAIAAIRRAVGDALLVQATTEGAGRYGRDEQIALADALAPEALSVAVREILPASAENARAAEFLARAHARGALVQYIVYDTADLRRLVVLHAQGVIPQRRPDVLFVLGSYVDQREGEPPEVAPLLAGLPSGWTWAVCAFGRRELQCVTVSALLGGQVRVGFENNMQLPSGEVAADNAALVAYAAQTLRGLGLRPATCAEARALLRT